MHKTTLACSTIFFALLVSQSSARETDPRFHVVVHESNAVERLSSSDVSRLMLKKSTRWEDGTRTLPVDQKKTCATRELFNREIHGRGGQAVASYWQSQIFSGGLVPPPVLNSDEEVIAYVREHPGAIGYVSGSASLEGVRQLPVIDD